MLQQLPRATRPFPALQEAPSEERLGTRDLMTFVRRYALGVGICVLVFVVLGQIYVVATPSTYVATTQVVIEERHSPWSGPGDVSFTQYSLDSSQIESQIQVVKSEQVAKRVVVGLSMERDPELTEAGVSPFTTVRHWFGLSAAPAPAVNKTNPAVRALSDRLLARRLGQSYVIEISYWSRDPETAARICNAATAAYIADLLQRKINAAEGGSEILERRINSLRAQLDAADRVIRTGKFDSETFPSADARVITTASTPDSRSWPRGSLVLAFSGLVGLFVGLFGAATHRGLDSSLHARGQVARDLGLTTLGILPRIRFRNVRQLADEVTRHPTSPFGTAMRQIRTAIQIRQADTALVCIGVTSTTDGEGKTTLAANLAQALAASECRVLLVDADIHASALTDMLAPEAPAGMIEMIDGPKPEKSVFQRVAAWQVDFLPVSGRAEWLAAIELPPAGRIGEFLSLCRKHYDIVLIDLPSLESGPDAKAISPHLDGMLFVVQAGHLRADRIAAAVETLRATNVDILGAVIAKSTSGVNV